MKSPGIGLCRDGRSIRAVKDQLTRLATAEIQLALAIPGTATRQVQAHIVAGFELWLPKDARQRVLWPSTVTLSGDYFASLTKHAVPLDERAIAALSHTAMGLDIYCWLAQRLHRVPPAKPAFVPWAALRDQFGWHYGRMRKFREVFRQTLALVASQYRAARIDLDAGGLTLRHSAPPVRGRMAVIRCAADVRRKRPGPLGARQGLGGGDPATPAGQPVPWRGLPQAVGAAALRRHPHQPAPLLSRIADHKITRIDELLFWRYAAAAA